MSHLTKAQRYTIFAMHGQGFTNSKIAVTIGKDKNTVGRKLKRNCDRRSGRYDANLTQRKYERRQREKPHRVRFTEQVRLRVEAMLRKDYSPEQVVIRYVSVALAVTLSGTFLLRSMVLCAVPTF